MAVEHLIVVDGYNLILRSPALRPGKDRTLEEARAKLVSLLSWAVGSGEARFVVVFDGADQGERIEGGGRVEVRYSRSPQKADDLIRVLVEDQVERVERLTVVTADIEVARHARAMGATIALSDLFLSSVLGPAAPGAGGEESEKPATLSKQELKEWAELFAARVRPKDEESEDEPKH